MNGQNVEGLSSVLCQHLCARNDLNLDKHLYSRSQDLPIKECQQLDRAFCHRPNEQGLARNRVRRDAVGVQRQAVLNTLMILRAGVHKPQGQGHPDD